MIALDALARADAEGAAELETPYLVLDVDEVVARYRAMRAGLPVNTAGGNVAEGFVHGIGLALGSETIGMHLGLERAPACVEHGTILFEASRHAEKFEVVTGQPLGAHLQGAIFDPLAMRDTGFGFFWPGWTIFGWGLILALHASLAILRQPITELAVTREQGA